ncbi:hypothetical protein [Eshraghiella crossota]|uniref:hypothetical protein n=1 Tax=Eshraghiella crossota TaxID=45851 RepID=UPI003F7F57D2
MKDNDKHGFGTFGAIVLGVTAVATAIVAVSKSKKKKQSLNSFLKDELVKLPLFSKNESHHAKKSTADEDDIFVDEDNEPQNDKATSFYDEEISYEEDEEFQSVSKAKPIVDFKPKHEEAEKPAEAQDAAGEPETAEAQDVAEEPETVEAQDTVEEPETADVQDVAEESEAADLQDVAEEPEAADLQDVTEEPEAADLQDAAEEPETTEAQDAAGEPETADVQDVTEEPEAADVQNVTEEPEAADLQDVTEEPETTDVQDVAEESEAEPDDTFVFESVVVGRESVKDEPVDISDRKLDREFIAEPVDAEPVRDNFVLNDEDFSDEVQEIEIDDVTAEPAVEKVTEPEKEDGPVSADKYDDVSSEAETAKETFAAAVETPVRETFSDVEFFDEEDDTEEGLRNNESYYDWTYNVDEHYSVITDGTWVYCKSDDVLTSDSINKKGERETIDIADTFKNRIKTKGYCLLKYIGTDREVIVPDTINGKPVVAALNTFRSNQIVKKVILPSTMQGLRRTFYSCYHLDSITFAPGTNLVYELDAIMCGNNDMDSNTEATTVYCSHTIAEYIKGHYRLGCPVTFVEK